MIDTNETPKTTRRAPLSGVVHSCPFCGSDEIYLNEIPSKDRTITFYKLVHGPHTECSVSFMHSNKERLFELWNQRACTTTSEYNRSGVNQ